MGRNYKTEIRKFPSTLDWALNEPIDGLAEFVRTCIPYPVLSVGSGGSYTSALFAALLHEHYSGKMAKTLTPLELVQTPLDFREMVVLFLTAGGRNPDIISSFDAAIQREPNAIGVLTTRSGGPLIDRAKSHANTRAFDFNIPSGKDGYLATNSLLATIVLLFRAYRQMGGRKCDRKDWEKELIASENGIEDATASLAEDTQHLWERDTLLVIHDQFTRPAALDIESRFAEAALGPVLVSDFRNFAHGRHYWLERLGDSTGILSLVTPRTEEISRGLMRLVPDGIPKLELNFGMDGIRSTIKAIIYSMLLAGCAADAQGLDPGRPTVPQFGRKMYRLRSLNKLRKKKSSLLSASTAAAIERKSRVSTSRLMADDLLPIWIDAYESFIKSLTESVFDGIAFDYDGTLCQASRRCEGPTGEVSEALGRLLGAGLPIGIATGRGKSVREQLQAVIPPEYWEQVLVAYYNGAEIAPLADTGYPDPRARKNKDLTRIMEILESTRIHRDTIEFSLRPNQLSVRSSRSDVLMLWEVVNDAVAQLSPLTLRVFRSGHSIDVIPNNVSKLHLLDSMQKHFALQTKPSILTIGDRGRWPGNDSEFLSNPNSLSVDETSTDAATCWNIAPPGKSGVDSTLEYLSLLVIKENCATVSKSKIEKLR